MKKNNKNKAKIYRVSFEFFSGSSWHVEKYEVFDNSKEGLEKNVRKILAENFFHEERNGSTLEQKSTATMRLTEELELPFINFEGYA